MTTYAKNDFWTGVTSNPISVSKDCDTNGDSVSQDNSNHANYVPPVVAKGSDIKEVIVSIMDVNNWTVNGMFCLLVFLLVSKYLWFSIKSIVL